MSKLPSKIKGKSRKEAGEWDRAVQAESPQKVRELRDQTEPFIASRPVGQQVSPRMDPFDIATLESVALRKGIPPAQLMARRIHKRIEHEKAAGRC